MVRLPVLAQPCEAPSPTPQPEVKEGFSVTAREGNTGLACLVLIQMWSKGYVEWLAPAHSAAVIANGLLLICMSSLRRACSRRLIGGGWLEGTNSSRKLPGWSRAISNRTACRSFLVQLSPTQGFPDIHLTESLSEASNGFWRYGIKHRDPCPPLLPPVLFPSLQR